MHTTSSTRRAIAGFTLLEVIFTVVVLAALAKFAMMKLVTPVTMTMPAQAQSVADMIRRAQSLAVVRGQRMSVAVAAGGVRVDIACASGSTPCNTDASLTVSQGAVVSGGTIYFNNLGQPMLSGTPGASDPRTLDASFTLSYTGIPTYTVTVAPLTGRVSVSSP